ncbi:hypothetical protein VaNZ11_008527, partial [Volvox africanus]
TVPHYALDMRLATAPPLVTGLLVEHLQAAAPGRDHSLRLEQIATVIMARIGTKTWQSYASHFSAFVRFCIGEGVDFLPASRYTGLLWAQFLAARGTVQARTAQPYFSAVNTVHDLLGFPKPCDGDNVLLSAFRRGWERLQVSLTPPSALVLAFSAIDAWSLYERLPSVPVASDLFIPLLFVVLSFCLFLRPDSLLSVVWARVSLVDGESTFQYKPLHWKGRLVAPELAPVLQFPLGNLPHLRVALSQLFARDTSRLWPVRQTTQGAERWFGRVLSQCGLERLRPVHTLYSLRRGGASWILSKPSAAGPQVPQRCGSTTSTWGFVAALMRSRFLALSRPGASHQWRDSFSTAERGFLFLWQNLVAGANAGYA